MSKRKRIRKEQVERYLRNCGLVACTYEFMDGIKRLGEENSDRKMTMASQEAEMKLLHTSNAGLKRALDIVTAELTTVQSTTSKRINDLNAALCSEGQKIDLLQTQNSHLKAAIGAWSAQLGDERVKIVELEKRNATQAVRISVLAAGVNDLTLKLSDSEALVAWLKKRMETDKMLNIIFKGDDDREVVDRYLQANFLKLCSADHMKTFEALQAKLTETEAARDRMGDKWVDVVDDLEQLRRDYDVACKNCQRLREESKTDIEDIARLEKLLEGKNEEIKFIGQALKASDVRIMRQNLTMATMRAKIDYLCQFQ